VTHTPFRNFLRKPTPKYSTWGTFFRANEAKWIDLAPKNGPHVKITVEEFYKHFRARILDEIDKAQ